MSATLVKENPIVNSVDYFLSKLENADNKSKNEIENMLVSIGSQAVPELVDKLQIVRGTVRGVVAMTLIRIGTPAIDYLKQAARSNKEFEWITNYLITEINGIAA